MGMMVYSSVWVMQDLLTSSTVYYLLVLSVLPCVHRVSALPRALGALCQIFQNRFEQIATFSHGRTTAKA